MDGTVGKLEMEQLKLDQETKRIKNVIKNFTQLAGDDKNVISEVKKAAKEINSMKKWIAENERVFLISTFYNCALKDNDKKMSENEYENFLRRLTRKQKSKFEHLGTFEILANGEFIDMPNFLNIIERVRDNVDEESVMDVLLISMNSTVDILN